MNAFYLQKKIMDNQGSDAETRLQELTNIMEAEREFEKKFDQVSQIVAERMGMKEIPWFKWTLNLTYFYACITCMVCFHRPDFVNVKAF